MSTSTEVIPRKELLNRPNSLYAEAVMDSPEFSARHDHYSAQLPFRYDQAMAAAVGEEASREIDQVVLECLMLSIFRKQKGYINFTDLRHERFDYLPRPDVFDLARAQFLVNLDLETRFFPLPPRPKI
jgi:hypothetical protein